MILLTLYSIYTQNVFTINLDIINKKLGIIIKNNLFSHNIEYWTEQLPIGN